jgi:hypothetical protein
MRVHTGLRLAVDLAKQRFADARREFECTVRELAWASEPPDGPWVLDINTYEWKRPQTDAPTSDD